MADSLPINGEVDVEIQDDDDNNDPKLSPLLQRIASLEQEKTQQLNNNNAITAALDKLKHDIDSSTAENDRLRSDSKALASIAARAAELEAEVARLQHDLMASTNEAGQIGVELVETKRALEELKRSDSSKGTKLEAIDKERKLLAEKIVKDGDVVKESNGRIGELERKIEALEARDGGYRRDKGRVEEEMRGRIEEREGEIRDLEGLVEELKAVLERSNKEREELEIVKNELEGSLRKSERKAKEMEGKLEVLHRELEGSERMICGLKEKAIEGINGEVEEKGWNLEWPVVVGVSAGAVVAVVYLRYLRQR